MLYHWLDLLTGERYSSSTGAKKMMSTAFDPVFFVKLMSLNLGENLNTSILEPLSISHRGENVCCTTYSAVCSM